MTSLRSQRTARPGPRCGRPFVSSWESDRERNHVDEMPLRGGDAKNSAHFGWSRWESAAAKQKKHTHKLSIALSSASHYRTFLSLTSRVTLTSENPEEKRSPCAQWFDQRGNRVARFHRNLDSNLVSAQHLWASLATTLIQTLSKFSNNK